VGDGHVFRRITVHQIQRRISGSLKASVTSTMTKEKSEKKKKQHASDADPAAVEDVEMKVSTISASPAE
jgi:hypothetical protein